MTVKDKLVEKLGTFGAVVYFILSLFVMGYPCVCLHFAGFAWWVSILAIAAFFLLPIGGVICIYVVWVVTFPYMLNGPMDFYAIAYFVSFAIFALTQGISDLISIAMAIWSLFTNK